MFAVYPDSSFLLDLQILYFIVEESFHLSSYNDSMHISLSLPSSLLLRYFILEWTFVVENEQINKSDRNLNLGWIMKENEDH